MNMTIETYTNDIHNTLTAGDKFDSVPLVVHRKDLAGRTERLAPVETVTNHRTQQIGGQLFNTKMEFLKTIKAEVRAKTGADDRDELETLNEQKAEDARLAAQFQKDEE